MTTTRRRRSSSGHSFRLFVLSPFGDCPAISHFDVLRRSEVVATKRERERVGGTETKFYPSSYVTGERVCNGLPTLWYSGFLSLSVECTYRPAKTSCIIRFVTNDDDDTHPLFFRHAREKKKKREGEKRIKVRAHRTVGLVRVELQISTCDSLQSNVSRCDDR